MPGVDGHRDAARDPAGRQPARRPDDAGQRAQGHRERHDDFAGVARQVDHGADPRPRNSAAAAVGRRRSSRTSAARSPSASSSTSIARTRAARSATARSIRRVSRWRASTSWAAGATAIAPPPRTSRAEKGIGKNGWPFAFHYALPVDSSGELPDGRAFKDIREFKQLLLHDEAQIARNLARQLVVYATGAPVRFSDRPQIEADPASSAKATRLRRPQPRACDRAERALPEQMRTTIMNAHDTNRIPIAALSSPPGVRCRAAISCAAPASRWRCRFSTRCCRRSRARRRRVAATAHAAADVRHLQQPRPAAASISSRRAPAATTRCRPTSSCCRSIATTSPSSAASRIRTSMAAIRRTSASSPPRRIRAADRSATPISLDQYIAERIGTLTRFPSLTLGVNTPHAQPLLDRHRRGHSARGQGGRRVPAAVPAGHAGRRSRRRSASSRPARASSTPSPARRRSCSATSARATASGSTNISPASATSSSGCRCRADGNASRSRWSNAPVPVDPDEPGAYMDKVKLMYDLARLAFETDSTRADHAAARQRGHPGDRSSATRRSPTATTTCRTTENPRRSSRQLKAIDEWHMKLLAKLFGDLKAVHEGGETLLDRTMILYGSNLGDANTHVCHEHAGALRRRRLQARPAPRLRHASTTIRCRISSSRCCSGWASKRTGSPPRPARCAAWR